ncbi:MAG: hypothetical protein O9249_00710, partial [Burkholderiaceae bacterium]|nr:hypothetical protein [Burkholderiaceae bacterium]
MKIQHPATIAGAGPAGMTATVDLMQQGIPVTLPEKSSTFSLEFCASTFRPSTFGRRDDPSFANPLVARGLKTPKVQYELDKLFEAHARDKEPKEPDFFCGAASSGSCCTITETSEKRDSMQFSDSAANYAKLSTPRLHDALPRRHLFTKLDSLRRSHAATWVVGIPGAGKTTLAATYLADRKLPSIWYQIDSTDADPAAFFYFLAQSLGSAGTTLPWLAAELADDLPRFARIFFRDFYKRLPSNTVVVFDNCQELDWITHGDLVEIAFNEIPEGINVLALSRDAPPPRLAHLELSGRIATLPHAALRLDTDEARALGQFGQDTVEADDDMDWLTQVDGWAAGIVMLRSHLAKTPGRKAIPKLEGRDAIFRYFAGVILERMPQASQIQLLMLSCLPSLSEADATELTGDESAARLLKRFYRDGLFIGRLGSKTPIYHFHSLFQEFLAQEAAHRLEPDMRSALLERAAIIIDGQGRTEEAARLYRDAKAFDSLSSLLI